MMNKFSEAVHQTFHNEKLHKAITNSRLTSEECDELIDCVTSINPEVERLTTENNELREVLAQVINRLENVSPANSYDPTEEFSIDEYVDSLFSRVKGTLEYIKSIDII